MIAEISVIVFAVQVASRVLLKFPFPEPSAQLVTLIVLEGPVIHVSGEVERLDRGDRLHRWGEALGRVEETSSESLF